MHQIIANTPIASQLTMYKSQGQAFNAGFIRLIAALLCLAAAEKAFAQSAGAIPTFSEGVSLPAGITPEMARQFMNNRAAGTDQSSPAASGAKTPDGPATLAERDAAAQAAVDSDSPADPANLTTLRPGSFAFFVAQATGKNLPIYGQALFSRRNTYSALESQPLPAQYVIGPGDELILKIYGGAVEVDQRVVVDRTGMIVLPKIGPISVAGLRLADLEPALKRQISKVLADFSLFVSMGQLRGIEIYVVGQARAPGKYVVSSVSTLINALFATGGPGANGSMRQIELVRNSKVVGRIDLYRFISRGDTSQDIRLLPGDVINIPAAGPRVALAGSVAAEAIFELSPFPSTTSVEELLSLAGGLPVVTSPLQASLERVEPGRNKPLLAATIALDDAGLKTPLKDGDILTLFPIKAAFENAVSLRILNAPAVRVPIEPGARVSAVIPSREALLTNAFWMRRFQAGTSNDNEVDRMNAIRSISKIDQINWEHAIIERVRASDLNTQVISFHLGNALLNRDPANDIELIPGDVITVFSQQSVAVPESRQTRVVHIQGEVNSPGIYQIRPGETLPELLARAGGLTANAYVFGAELSRLSVREQQQKNLNIVIQRLESQVKLAETEKSFFSSSDLALNAQLTEQNRQIVRQQISRLRGMTPNGRVSLELDPKRQRLPELSLEDGDRINIPRPPGHVVAVGAVYNDSVLIYKPGRTVTDYLRAAGVSDTAERESTFVVRADGSILAPTPSGFLSFNRFNGTQIAALELMPGDTIVVPEQVSRESGYSVFMRGLKDWTQVLYQLGLAAAAVNTLK